MEFSLSSPGFHWVPKLQRAEWEREGVQIFIERGTRKLEFVNFCGKGLSERKLLRRWLLSSSLGISSPEQQELWCDLERARFVVCSAACCKGHGVLCEAYPNKKGAFNAEGDTPAFLHTMSTGLRNMENPGYGGWGGRYVKVRNNVWMDPQPSSEYKYPDGQYGFDNSWSKMMEHYKDSVQIVMRTHYFKPLWRWLEQVQKDFAARADWCVNDYESANHHPIVNLNIESLDLNAKTGDRIILDASKSVDPDGDNLSYHWWMYPEAGKYKGDFYFESNEVNTVLEIPLDARSGETIHIICEVSDDGVPSLTKYKSPNIPAIIYTN